VLAPAIVIRKARIGLVDQARTPSRFLIEPDHRVSQRLDVLRFEELHHLLVEVTCDRAGPWSHARNSDAYVLEQLRRKHDVGASADPQRNQSYVGVLDHGGDLLDRNEALAESDGPLQPKLVAQRDQWPAFLTGPDDAQFEAGDCLPSLVDCPDGEIQAQAARERAVVDNDERSISGLHPNGAGSEDAIVR